MDLRVYIAGKITGEDPVKCMQKFEAAEAKLRRLGVQTIINPKKLGIPDSWTWKESEEICKKVLRENANAIYLLNDWISSEGAMEEYHYARCHAYRIFTEDDSDMIVASLPNSNKWIHSDLEFP